MNERQLATFRISEDEIRKDPQRAADLFARLNFVCVRAEHLFVERQIEYTGISHCFKKVEYGDKVPTVQLQVTHDSSGGIELVDVVYD